MNEGPELNGLCVCVRAWHARIPASIPSIMGSLETARYGPEAKNKSLISIKFKEGWGTRQGFT